MVPSLWTWCWKSYSITCFSPTGKLSPKIRREGSESMCVWTCAWVLYPALREHQSTVPAQEHPYPFCSSESPRFSEKGIQVHPSHPLFPCRAAYVSPCTQPTLLAREWWDSSHGCSCLLSLVLHPPVIVALGQEPHFPLCSPSKAQQVGHGQGGCEKGGRLKVTLPFPFCRAEWGLWHSIPAGSLPPAVNRHWAHTLAASSACWIAAAIRPAQ